jgi:ABC-type transport system involved in multi-copper enzyme maturation permease subunit
VDTVTFLPIVERELRVAARKRSTFWVRIVAALVALVIGGGLLLLSTVGPLGSGRAMLGRTLFGTLTWLSLAVALSAGLFFTSDCLSEEKREGTIGLLFLTDLNGLDVVLGKLLATSLRGFYALLAVFPIVAVTLLMGGVTGPEFWKTMLALINALLVSLAAGLLVSALSRDSQKALGGTLLLLLLLAAGGPIGDAAIAAVTTRGVDPVLRLSSPVHLFLTASGWGGVSFGMGFLVNQGLAWTLLALTCVVLPRAWQEKTTKKPTATGAWAQWWKYGSARRRSSLRRRLIGINPVLWLGCRERWQTVALWTVVLCLTGGFAVVLAGDDRSWWWMGWTYFAGAVSLIVYLGMASQAGRFFVEAKRTGLIELLLASPLTAPQIVQGQWRALARMFGPALTLCLALQFVGGYLVQKKTWSRLTAATAARTARVPSTAMATNAAAGTSAGTNAVATTNLTAVRPSAGAGGVGVTSGALRSPNSFLTLAISVTGTLTVAANLVALTWFGMWMGLNSKNTNLATLKTIVFVQIIPWFAVSFLAGLMVPLLLISTLIKRSPAGGAGMMVWYPFLLSGVATLLYVAKDVAFFIWARKKLHSELRVRAMPIVIPIRRWLPPPLPRAGLTGGPNLNAFRK